MSADGFFVPFLSAGVMGRPVRCVPKEKCSLALVIFAMLACDRENNITSKFSQWSEMCVMCNNL